MKKWFDVDGDYLSAFATLIAAMVAAYLFNDWKEQHNKEVLNKFRLNIYDLYLKLISNTDIQTKNINTLEEYLVDLDYECNIAIMYQHNTTHLRNDILENFFEIEVIFHQLHEQFTAYSIIKNSISLDLIRYNEYLNASKAANSKFDDYIINSSLKVWERNLISIKDIIKNIKINEIDDILNNLQEK